MTHDVECRARPRTLSSLGRVAALLVALLAASLLGAPAWADDTAPATEIAGQITNAKTGKGLSQMTVHVFDVNWVWIGKTTTSGNGGYGFQVPAGGSYRLKIEDTRENWDVTRMPEAQSSAFAVAQGKQTVKNVAVKPGVTVTGTVKRGKKRAAYAKVRVIHSTEYYSTAPIEVTANKKGQFAVGGIPAGGTVTVYVANRSQSAISGPIRIRRVKAGASTNLNVKLKIKAVTVRGTLQVNGAAVKETLYVTLVNRATGSWVVVPVRRGKLVARGLEAGKYTLKVPQGEKNQKKTVKSTVTVKAGKTLKLGTVKLASR